MTLFFDKIFPSNVIAFVSDASIDFKLSEHDNAITDQQKKYLSVQSKTTLPEVFTVRQVHGKKIVPVRSGEKHPQPLLEADGMMTKDTNTPLTARTADCLSVFLYDAKNKAASLVHAGWKGTEQKIVVEAIRRMKEEWKTEAKDLKVAFGPSIRKCCYEVGNEFFKYFLNEIVKVNGKDFLDLPLVNKRQLMGSGVEEKNIFDCGKCTFCDKTYFSFRRDNESAGRMISFMMVK